MAELFKIIYVGEGLSASNFAIVVEENNIVQGFLFGKCGNEYFIKTEYNGIYGKLKILYQILFLKGVALKRKLQYLQIIGDTRKTGEKLNQIEKMK